MDVVGAEAGGAAEGGGDGEVVDELGGGRAVHRLVELALLLCAEERRNEGCGGEEDRGQGEEQGVPRQPGMTGNAD